MNMPFYVAPEQVMKDRADYARKGIARGRSLVAVSYSDGIAICAENPSSTLNKISEIYDRIAFAGVGKYNEFDQLRIAGVRHADLKGYIYSRADVDARSLANQYAQILGDVFTHKLKPMEVEILVAEIGDSAEDDRMFHILYDGTVDDESTYMVIGGEAESISDRLADLFKEDMSAESALRCAVRALSGPDSELEPSALEAAVLARSRGRRNFHRLTEEEIGVVLANTSDDAPEAPPEAPGEAAGEAAPAKAKKQTKAKADTPEDSSEEDEPSETRGGK